eukprot:2620048-Prymnesium_polylepis.1
MRDVGSGGSVGCRCAAANPPCSRAAKDRRSARSPRATRGSPSRTRGRRLPARFKLCGRTLSSALGPATLAHLGQRRPHLSVASSPPPPAVAALHAVAPRIAALLALAPKIAAALALAERILARPLR